MTYLTAAVVLLTVAVLANLWLTLTTARTVRDLDARLKAMMRGPQSEMTPLGLPVGPFSVTTVDGDPLTRDDLTGWTLVATLTSDCHVCAERLPEFLNAASVLPGGRGRVLAVVPEPQPPVELLAKLAQVAVVVSGAQAEQVAAALGVELFPTFSWVGPDHVVEFAGPGIDLSLLPVEALA
jgi:hypothetical protein